MKKLLLSLLMLCSMTAAWAGEGTGTKDDPFRGEWDASVLVPELNEGDHLAYDCVISGGWITVYDDKLDQTKLTKFISQWKSWAVGSPISKDPKDDSGVVSFKGLYDDYCDINSLAERQKHTFIVTKKELPDKNTYSITGHYTGCYDRRGDGSKNHPFIGEWTIHELYDKLEDGVHLAIDCDIKGNDDFVSVTDTRLNQQVASMWGAWSPGNLIGDAQLGGHYTQYGKDNSFDKRKGQTFIVTEKDILNGSKKNFIIRGHFSGFYSAPDADGFVYVATTEQMWIVLHGNDNVKANARAKVRLTADFALSDIDKDNETYCDTFYGTIDGNGHTIKGDPEKDVRSRTFMFSMSDGATFKNLTFKGIRVNSQDNPNQAIITSKAQNHCVFENITFENVHTFSDDDDAAAAAGWAQDCTFTNITVKNSDFTTDMCLTGAVVGHAIGCTFENIKVENCESTSDDGYSGGVAGRAADCKFNNVEILGIFVKTYGLGTGGVVGQSKSSNYTNCKVDDQSCICADGVTSGWGRAGGIVGEVDGDSFTNCINSALIAADSNCIGGIAGFGTGLVSFDDCLNTGMVISMDMDDVKDSFYNKYKTKSGLDCATKTYKGKEYVIRKYKAVGSYKYVGGIVGEVLDYCTINRCANLGSVYSTDDDYVGGIAGIISLGKVTNCLSDFHAGSDTDAICAAIGDDNGGECFIGSCLNMTTYKDFSAYDNNWVGFKSDEKNYSLTTNKNVHHVKNTTAAKIKSGEICLKLGASWEQNIGTDAYPTPTGNRGIYHMRDVCQKEYGTICVPFPLETLKGEGIDHREYYLFDEVKNEADGTVSICFKYTEVVPAGTPAIFRAYVNSDYYFVPMEKEYLFDIKPTVGTEWTFNGTFEQKVFEGEDAKSIYYLDGTVDKSAIKNAQKTTIAPFRAYFQGPSIDELNGSGNGAPAKAIRFVIEDEDGETTEIKLADFNENQNFNFNGNFNGKTYSIMGTQVNENYRGIVIKNGKKIICE